MEEASCEHRADAICLTDSTTAQHSVLGCVVHNVFPRLRVRSIEFLHINCESPNTNYLQGENDSNVVIYL